MHDDAPGISSGASLTDARSVLRRKAYARCGMAFSATEKKQSNVTQDVRVSADKKDLRVLSAGL